MTPESHPHPSLIAAHADRRLTGDEAARMDDHVASCPECYQVFAETVRFGLDDAARSGAKAADARVAPPVAFIHRPAVRFGLGVAAVLVVALVVWVPRAGYRAAPAPAISVLAEALGDQRFVEPRLTGGFRHGRLTVLRSGEAAQGLDAQPPAVIAAVARIREQAQGDTSPAALGAVGITHLVSGDVAAAVKALESATAQAPEDPRLLSDLAAVYLVRADRSDEPADIPKGLESAERAIALKDAPAEAWFNRALALERLHLVDAARKAWEDYLERDPSSGWADEARQHLEALPKPRQSSAEEDKARVRAALEQGAAAVDRLADESPSLLRDYFEDELLPAWADAYLVGHPDAALHRDRARLIGDALLRTTNDALPRDTARALSEPLGTSSSPDPLRSQALGLRALHEATRLYALDEPSCASVRDSLRDLQAGGSPRASWARFQVVVACLYPSAQRSALDELGSLSATAEQDGYLQLLGRVRWMQGLFGAYRGDLTAALELYRSAHASFVRTGDTDSAAFILAASAETLQLLGESRSAWRDREHGLALLDGVRNPRRRHGILMEGVQVCLSETMPRTALYFGNALVEAAFAWGQPRAVSDALIRRASIQHSLGNDDRSVSDLQEARRSILQITDAPLAVWQEAEANAAEGEVLVRERPEEAARSLEKSIGYFRSMVPARLPPLHLLLGRAQMARGLDTAAEGALTAGIESMERGRRPLRDAALQASFFDQSLTLFDEMVRLQVSKRQDPERALAFVERGRARQLVDSLAGARLTPLDPKALQRELPDGVALVYYTALEERLFAWAVTRGELHFIERPLRAAELSRLIAANRAAIEGRASQALVRLTAARLHDELVRPLLPFIASQRALVFLPDGALQSLPFASLWNRQSGRYLAEEYLLGVASSGTAFVRASSRAAQPREKALRALVVANPHVDRHRWADMPSLPGAEEEGTEIAALYRNSALLTGPAATKGAFLERVADSEVVHFAGHAAASADASSPARLLFAPDPRTGDSGALYLRELDRRSLPHTRVVVLAACRTAAGAVSRVEGALSLGRPFLAAGVPDVVASLWDIDDSVSRRFFIAFHHSFLAEGDPVLALRAAQMTLLHGDDASLAHPASWAGFICMGGLDPRSIHSLSKGEVS